MIKFVYFDIGGVTIKDFSDSNKWRELQKSLGVPLEKADMFLTVWNRHKNRECIDYDVDDTLPELQKELGLSIPNTVSILQGFIDRFEKNKSIWPVIELIRKKVRFGLLTNMYPRMLSKIEEKNLLPPVKWDLIIDSSVVKLQKPDPKIFTYAQKKTGVNGNEILFIDNQEKHLKAAQKCGWQTFHYESADYEKSSEELEEYMHNILIK